MSLRRCVPCIGRLKFHCSDHLILRMVQYKKNTLLPSQTANLNVNESHYKDNFASPDGRSY